MRRQSERIQELSELLLENNIDLILLTRDSNVRYFTGYSGEGVAVLSSDGTGVLYVESIDAERAEEESIDRVSVTATNGLADPLEQALRELGSKRISLGIDSLPAERYAELLQSYSVVLKPAEELIWRIRSKKDEEEKRLIKEAAHVAAAAVEMAAELLTSDTHASELKALVVEELMRRGVDEIPETPSITPPKPTYRTGDTLVLAVTASKMGYAARVTRTITIGNSDAEVERARQAVVEWINACEEKVTAWSPALDIYDMLREKLGSLEGVKVSRVVGHGIGLDIREPPLAKPLTKELIPSDAVLVLEPRLLLPSSKWFSLGEVFAVERDGLKKLSPLGYTL